MRRELAAIAAAVLIPACTAQGGVTITLDEYSLRARPATEAAGEVTFTARNEGAIAHQLVVLRTERRPDRLRVRKGIAVTTDRGITPVGDVPAIAGGDSEALSLDLTPGRYVLICNIVGHYENGMRAGFEVR